MFARFRFHALTAIALCAAASAAGAQTVRSPFPMLASTMTLNVSSDETKGASATITAKIPPKWGPPPHVHSREDEVYVVMKGKFRFTRGSDVITGGPGSVVFFPRNVPHTFANMGSTPGTLVFTLIPAGLEKMFLEISRRGLKAPKDIGALVALGKDYGITYLPPPPR